MIYLWSWCVLCLLRVWCLVWSGYRVWSQVTIFKGFEFILFLFLLWLQNEDRVLWKLGTLPPGLITFYGLTHPLEKSWHVLGLGYNPSVDRSEIENAAVIHYNGNMKPWLELAMTKYRSYWSKYIKYDHPYIRNCKLSEWRTINAKVKPWHFLTPYAMDTLAVLITREGSWHNDIFWLFVPHIVYSSVWFYLTSCNHSHGLGNDIWCLIRL